jgi:stringent starvation protein B
VQVDEHTRVPREFVKDGQIVLNVSAEAAHQLQLGNEEITFQTRFNGASFPVVVPVAAVLAIYARENGQGMAFEATKSDQAEHESPAEAGADSTADSATESASEKPPARRGGHLTRIK